MPPVVLEILVDADKGIVALRQFDKAVSDTAKTTQQTSQAQHQAAQSTTSFGASLAATTKSAIGLSLGFAGVAGIATTLGAAATAATGFEAALNSINALGTVSARQLSTLREQLLALPPALGSSTELAKGLYDILGANVPADNAITVLTRSAELAKGGLGNLDTAINAVTKSAAAFGIPLEQAQFVTDVFTQTVIRGQGRLEEFAQAFPQVAATAAATGASFIDTNAAIAVLTQTFKNADTAATGLNSFFQQLIQNSAKFAAEGINVKQVLAEEGLTGLFRRLNEVTGGSAERLKELINDSEGFRAALTLTGNQFNTFNETVGSYANVTGLAQQAASKNLADAGAAWQTFINTLDRLVQEVAPPLLEVFTNITRAASVLAADVTKLYRAFAQSETLRTMVADFEQFFQVIGQSAAFQTLNANLLTTTGNTTDTYNAFVILDELLKGNVRPSIDFVTAGWDLLNAAFDYTAAGVIKLGQYLIDGLVTPLAQVFTALDQAATALGISDGRFSQLAATSQQLSADLALASATFQGMADEFVLGTNRIGMAQDGASKAVATTTAAVNAQSTALPQQGTAAAAAAAGTAQLTEAQQKLKTTLDDANDAASTLQGTLDKLKPGDAFKAISADELTHTLGTVTAKLIEMEKAGTFTAREISRAYDEAAAVLRERFGVLPDAFQRAFDAMRARASTTADGIALAFERMGLQTRDALQRTATDALADFQAIEKAGTASPRALLDAWLDVVDQIDKGAFKILPEGFQASSTRMQEIARKLGVELPQPIVNAFGEIAVAGQSAAEAIDTSWLQTRGALERASQATTDLGRRTDEAAKSTKALTEEEKRLGFTLDENGEKIKKVVSEWDKLMSLKILPIEIPFATELAGLQEQLAKAYKDLNLLGYGATGLGVDSIRREQGELQKLITELEKRIADLKQQTAASTPGTPGTPTPGTGTGTPATGTGTGATGGGTTAAPLASSAPTAGSGGLGVFSPTSPTLTQRPGAPGMGPGGGGGLSPTSPGALQRPGAPLAPTGPLVGGGSGSLVVGGGSGGGQPPGFPVIGGTVPTLAPTQRTIVYNLTVHTQAQDAATLARDLVPYLRQADLSQRPLGG